MEVSMTQLGIGENAGGNPATETTQVKFTWSSSDDMKTTVTKGTELEGHFKWLNEYLTLRGEAAEASAADYIRTLLVNTRLSDEEETLYRRVTDLCWKLNLAAQYAFVEDYETALKCIKMAEDELEFHVLSKDMAPPLSHIIAYKYCIQVSVLSTVNHWINKHGIKSLNVATAETLKMDWTRISNDKRSMAVVHYFKACLAISIRLEDEIILSEIKQAIALEPDFHGWYRYLYRKLRQIRRSSGQMAPNNEEKEACKMAYQLRPDLGDNIAIMANFLEENLNSSKRTMGPEAISQQLQNLIILLKDSLKMKDDPWTALRLAEIYGFGHYKSQLDATEGETMFKQCLEKWPSNSMVWHKAGKFYHLGGFPRGGGPHTDKRKALQYYEHALKLSSCNYPCLMDYLKLLGGPMNRHSIIPSVIDKYMPSYTKESELMKLLIIKGTVLWNLNSTVQDRQSACLCWLEIIKRFPHLGNEVVKYLKHTRMDVVGVLDLKVEEIIVQLMKLSTFEDSAGIAKFMNALLVRKDDSTNDNDTRTNESTHAGVVNEELQNDWPPLSGSGLPTPVERLPYVREVESQPGVAYISKGRGRGRGLATTSRFIRK